SLVMQNTAIGATSAAPDLQDGKLFREACYVDGQWIQGSGATISVDNPATGHRSGAESLPGVEREDCQGTSDRAAKVVRPDDGQSGRPRTADDHRTGQ